MVIIITFIIIIIIFIKALRYMYAGFLGDVNISYCWK